MAFSIPLPEPLAGKHIPNELDRLLRKMRLKNLKDIVDKCEKLPNMEFKAVLQELENFYRILDQLEEDVSLFYYFKFKLWYFGMQIRILLLKYSYRQTCMNNFN